MPNLLTLGPLGLPMEAASRVRLGPPTLIAAVAAIVGLAAERARMSGDLQLLRDAIERALDPGGAAPADPREAGGAELPCIADADPVTEGLRLRALLARGAHPATRLPSAEVAHARGDIAPG